MGSPLYRQQLVAPEGAAGRSVLQSPRLSRFQHDRARRVAYVIDGLFGIGFLVPIRRVRGFMLHGGSLIIESVSSDFCFVLLPPVLLFFCAAPCPALFVPWAAQMPTVCSVSVLVFSFLQQFPAACIVSIHISPSTCICKSADGHNKNHFLQRVQLCREWRYDIIITVASNSI